MRKGIEIPSTAKRQKCTSGSIVADNRPIRFTRTRWGSLGSSRQTKMGLNS